jgi:hypothetical protein
MAAVSITALWESDLCAMAREIYNKELTPQERLLLQQYNCKACRQSLMDCDCDLHHPEDTTGVVVCLDCGHEVLLDYEDGDWREGLRRHRTRRHMSVAEVDVDTSALWG